MIRQYPNYSSENDVQRHAYEIWLREGCPEGRSLEHWLLAEQELRNPRFPQSAIRPPQSIYFWDYHG